MRTRFACSVVLLLFVVLLLCSAGDPVVAQSKPPATSAVTQQLIDDVVDAISAAVVEKLKKDGTIATKPVEPAAPVDEPDPAAERATAFVARAEAVLGGYPDLGRSLARIPVILDKSDAGGRGLGPFLMMLGAFWRSTPLF